MKKFAHIKLLPLIVLFLFALIGCNDKSVTVNFETNGGNVIAPITLDIDTAIQGTFVPVKTGSTFGGWYTNAALTEPFDIDTLLGDDITLYAKWTINTYTVTIVIDEVETTQQVDHGSNATLPADPVKTGYDFLGWYVGEVVTDGTNITGSQTITARFSIQVFTINFNDGTNEFTYDVSYGYSLEMIPTITPIEGKTAVWNVTDFTNITQDMNVTATYTDITFTVTFSQLLWEVDKYISVSATRTVLYGGTITDAPSLNAHGTDTCIWDRTDFSDIKSDLTIHALYYDPSKVSLQLIDSKTIIFFTDETEISTTAPIFSIDDLALFNALSKPGYIFLGWFTEATGGTQVTLSELTLQGIGTSKIYYSHWLQLDAFAKPTNVSVTGNTITWTQTPLLTVYPSIYIITVDGIEYEVELTSGVTTYLLPGGRLVLPGTHSVTVTAKGNNTSNISSPASSPYSFVVETQAEDLGEVLSTEIRDYYIVEVSELGTTYIFYTGMEYAFVDDYVFTILQGEQYVTAIEHNILKTNNTPGSFRFKVQTPSGLKTYYGKVIQFVSTFTMGDSLQDYTTNAQELASATKDDDAYGNTELTPYLVGSRNAFHFELSILDRKGSRVGADKCELIYTFYLKSAPTVALTGTTLSNYLSETTPGMFDFTPTANGVEFIVKIEPKYQANEVTVPSVNFGFTVNDAYNVFTNEELKLYYKDLTIQTINIHSDIVAELSPDQMNPDGSPINGWAVVNASGNLERKGDVYERLGLKNDDNFVLNGNYFTIDGSDLPFCNVHSDPTGGYTTTGFDGAFEVISVQIGILYYYVYPSNGSSTNDNRFTINNLTLLGNTVTPYINYEDTESIESQEALMSRNSGGFAGIMVRGGEAWMNNLNVGNTGIGFFSCIYGTKSNGTTPLYMNLDYVHIYDSWANSMYGWGVTGFIIENSNIETSGGAAIHVEDPKAAMGGINDPFVSIDDATQINNWVSGEEAWFKAYGMTIVANQIKSQVENGINPYGKSVIRRFGNETDGFTEKMNLVLLNMAQDGAQGTGENPSGSQVRLALPTASGSLTSIAHPYTFVTTDPRSAGAFAFPICAYSDLTAFGAEAEAAGTALVTKLMTDYAYSYNDAVALASANAANIVLMESFYNLTRTQAVDAAIYIAGGMAQGQAMVTACGGSMPAEQPRYFEVGQEVLAGAGASTVILEFNNDPA